MATRRESSLMCISRHSEAMYIIVAFRFTGERIRSYLNEMCRVSTRNIASRLADGGFGMRRRIGGTDYSLNDFLDNRRMSL